MSDEAITDGHTPGPWTVEHYGDGDSLVLHSDGNTRICFMATPGSSPRAFPQIEANARLISAAPDLYEALKDNLDRFVAAFPDAANYEPIKRGYAALAKAHPQGGES